MGATGNMTGIGLNVPEPPVICSDKNCPFHGTLSVRGQQVNGTVASTDMDKTVVVEREYDVFVPKYDRHMKRRSRIPAHHPPCIELEVGDRVEIAETRRLSKTKSHVVVERVKSMERMGRIMTEKKGDYTQIKVDGKERYAFKEYDEFYGLYWQSQFDPIDFLSAIGKLAKSSETVYQSNKFINGLFILDGKKEIEVGSEQLSSIFDEGTSQEETKGDLLTNHFPSEFKNVDLNSRLTLIRINTQYFNMSWEKSKTGIQIGMLKDDQIREIDVELMANSVQQMSYKKEVAEELNSVLTGKTQTYANHA